MKRSCLCPVGRKQLSATVAISCRMAGKVMFRLPGGELRGELTATDGVSALLEQLPLSANGNVWGEEIYFEIPKPLIPGIKTKEVDVGDIAYWDEGRSVCIFFGPTPVSRSSRPEPYVPVYRLGRVGSSGPALQMLSSFAQGQMIVMESVACD